MLVKDNGKKTSATLYLCALVANDIVMLVIYLLYFWLNNLINFTIETTSSFGCSLTLTLNTTTQTLAAWLVIVLIIERLIYLYFPRITKLFSRRMTGIFTIIIVVCIAFFFNSHYIWFELQSYKSQTDNTTFYYCVANRRRFLEYTTIYENYSFAFIGGLCPAICIVIGNIFFVKSLYRTVRATERNGLGNVDVGKNRDLLVCTMVISILFLVLDVPRTFDNSFDLFGPNKFIFTTLALIYRSVKLFVYILYKRGVRVHCVKKLVKSHGIRSNP